MAHVLVTESSLQDIADAIREKNGSTETYIPSAMGAAIRALSSGLKSASGTGKLSALQGNIYPLIVTGLEFDPCAVFYGTYSLFPTEGIAPADFGFVVYDQNRENCTAIRMPLNTDSDAHRTAKTYATSNIMQGGFNVPQYKGNTVSTSRTYYWLALGV